MFVVVLRSPANPCKNLTTGPSSALSNVDKRERFQAILPYCLLTAQWVTAPDPHRAVVMHFSVHSLITR